MIRQLHEGLEAELSLQRGLFNGGVAAILQQVMVQINFHRTRLGACAAERRCVGKMFPILQAAQVRRDDRTDRAAVSRAVSMATDVAEYRADVQARTASALGMPSA